MIRLKFCTILALAITSLVTSNASADVQVDDRFWLNITAQGDFGNQAIVSDKLRWYVELQPRWRGMGENFDQLLIRPAVYYKLSDQSSFWFGYGLIQVYPEGKTSVHEHRLWQQFQYLFNVQSDISVTTRTRLEERRLESYSDTGYRLRQMLRMAIPISSSGDFGFIAWDEVFVNLNDTDWGAQSGFDQNRGFVGGFYEFSKDSKIEMGYLSQFVKATGDDRVNHVLSTTLQFNF